MAHKRENDYFELLCRQVAHCTEAAGLLQAILADFDPAALQDQLASLHQVEHRADLVKHEMMEKLLHEFITPSEREDITALAQEIDNVTDNLSLIHIFVIVKLFEPHLVLPLQKSQFSSQAVIPHNSSEGFTSQQKLPGKRSGTALFSPRARRKKRPPLPLAKSALLSNRFSIFPALHLQKQKRKRFPFCCLLYTARCV